LIAVSLVLPSDAFHMAVVPDAGIPFILTDSGVMTQPTETITMLL